MLDECDELISVLIIEDHPIFREALRGYLETRPDRFLLVGDAAGREYGLQLVREHVPDIVLLDLGLPERTEDGIEEGLELIQIIYGISPTTQVVVLTAYRRMDAVFRAIQAGAVAYMLKDHVTGQEVIENLLRVKAGDPPVDPEIARKLWNFFQGPDAEEYTPFDGLTSRELEVLRLIAERRNNQEIAEKLCISLGTVKKHVSNILSKLQLHNRMELVAFYRTRQPSLADKSPSPALPV